jgi:hypothetical protein
MPPERSLDGVLFTAFSFVAALFDLVGGGMDPEARSAAFSYLAKMVCVDYLAIMSMLYRI